MYNMNQNVVKICIFVPAPHRFANKRHNAALAAIYNDIMAISCHAEEDIYWLLSGSVHGQIPQLQKLRNMTGENHVLPHKASTSGHEQMAGKRGKGHTHFKSAGLLEHHDHIHTRHGIDPGDSALRCCCEK